MTQVGTLNNGEKINYASGLGIDKHKGLNVIQHGGAMAGYTTEQICGVGATGSARLLIGKVLGADIIKNETRTAKEQR